MTKNFISIITPTLNSAEALEKTMISIANQTSKNFEHIIIDSKSTDKTLSIIEKYQNVYSFIFKSEHDSGISDAFNKGINLAAGNWLIFLGAGDELISPNILSEMEKILASYENSLIVWGNIIHKDRNGKIGKIEKGKFRKNALKRFMCLPHQAAFHNKVLFCQYGLFDTQLKVAMDYDLCLKIYPHFDFNSYINKNITYMLSDGISQIGENAIKEYLIVQKKHKIWNFRSIPKILYYWAKLKYRIKILIRYNSTGL